MSATTVSPLALTLASFRAEWLKLRYRPATWVLGILLVASVFTLGYALVYVGILLIEQTATTAEQLAGSQVLRDDLAPARFVNHVVALLVQPGGPIALILGALAIGSEFGWGTLKTMLTQRPGRLALGGGKVLALALVLLVFVATALLAGLLGSLIFTAILGSPLGFPSVLTLLKGIGAGCMILAVWTMLGVALATLFSNTAVAIGLGLVYALVLEFVVGTVAFFVEQVRTVQQYFLGAIAGELANTFAGSAASSDTVGATRATLVLLAYLAVFLVVAALVLRRRDVV